MNSDVVRYESTIRLYEQDLGEIDQDTERLENEILRMQSELKRLAARKVSRLQMYVVTKNGVGLPLTEDERKYLPPEVEHVNSIPSDAFKGMKLVEAAEAYLIWRDEPATHREVQDGIRAGGLDVQLKSLDNSLRSAMQRSGKFKWYKDEEDTYRWALLHWINRSPREAEAQSASEKPNLALVGGSEAIAKQA